MSRTRGLAGGGAGFVAVDAVIIAVVEIELLGAPVIVIGQLMPGILNGAVLGAELLAELDGARGAVFNAAAAGHAVFGGNSRNICRARHIGRVEKLGGAQCVADIDVAVAYSDDLVLAVDIGYLMDIAVILGLLQDIQRFLIADIASALLGLDYIFCHVADCDAPILRIVAAALAQYGSAHAAGAGACRILIVLVQPMRNMLNIQRLLFGGYGLLDRNHVHTYARSAGRHHFGNLYKRQNGHALEKSRGLGIFVKAVPAHVGILRASDDEYRQNVLKLLFGIFPVKLKNALVKQRVEKLPELLLRKLRIHLSELRERIGLAYLHLEGDVRHFVGHAPVKAVILRIAGLYLAYAVGYLLSKIQNFLSCRTLDRLIVNIKVVGYVFS